MDKVECEIFLAMNEDGGWVVGKYESSIIVDLDGQEGGYHARVVKVKVFMSPPVMTEATVDVPDEAGETTKVEGEAV